MSRALGLAVVSKFLQIWLMSIAGLFQCRFLDAIAKLLAKLPVAKQCWLACNRQFGSKVRNWATFNEPGVFAFSGYIYGTFCPGKFFATHLAGLVVKHMLIAHTDAYKAIKALPGEGVAGAARCFGFSPTTKRESTA